MINSPRSLEACNLLGVQPSELYQITLEQFKKKYPDAIGLSPEILQYRYDEEEKFRLKTIEEVKNERNKIIEAQNKKEDEAKTNRDIRESTVKGNNLEDTERIWGKIIENEKKAIEKIKKKQRQDIQTIIEEQINKELMKRLTEVKERNKKLKEEEAEKQLI